MKRKIIKAYDNYAKYYYSKRLRKRFVNTYIELPAMLSLLKNVKNKKILDLGCGPGILSKILAKRGAKVTAIDLSPEMVAIAKKYAKVNVQLADAEKLPFKSETFDIVCSSLLIEHLENIRMFFKKINKILKPSGIFIISTAHPFRNIEKFNNYFLSKWQTGIWDKRYKIPIKPHTFEEIINSLVSCNFAIQKILEPKPIPKAAKENPEEYEKYKNKPYFLIIESEKVMPIIKTSVLRMRINTN